ncbi:hypothetical protein [Williamsia sp. M5A3_1d]
MADAPPPDFSGRNPDNTSTYAQPVFPGRPLPPPSDDSGSPGRKKRGLIIGGCSVVAIIAAVALGLAAVGDEGGPKVAALSASAAGPGTSANPSEANCDQVQLSPANVRGDGDTLVAEVEFKGPCSEAVLASSEVPIVMRDGPLIVGAAVFDFSNTPLSVSRTGGTAQLRFGPDQHWALPSSVTASDLQVSFGSAVEVDADASTSGSSAADPVSASSFLPEGVDVQGVAAEALQRLRQEDRISVDQDAAERWVPQLSSKQPGLDAEGRIWTNVDILREQFELRARYPQTRIVWTDDWSAFDLRGWWVAIVAQPSSSPDEVLDWCVAQRLDRDHCIAKRLARQGGSAGTTVLQK